MLLKVNKQGDVDDSVIPQTALFWTDDHETGFRIYKNNDDVCWSDCDYPLRMLGIYNLTSVPVMVFMQEGNPEPQVVLGWEDDGKIGFDKDRCGHLNSFSYAHIPGLIAGLGQAYEAGVWTVKYA
jgi:predicted ATP-grasp superfamily ATP-dependent carboligase